MEINERLTSCSFMDIKELPLYNYNTVEVVYCIDCPLLKELPNWPVVSFVSLSGCLGIEKLPDWINVRSVYCENCPKIKKFPIWPKLEKLRCRGSGIFDKFGIENAADYRGTVEELIDIPAIVYKSFKIKKLQIDPRIVSKLAEFL
jgi:hypothetical protein